MLPGAILGVHQHYQLAGGAACAHCLWHIEMTQPREQWVWNNLDSWGALPQFNLPCCHSVRQWWLWSIEQRGTGRTALQKNDLIATGCRDACSLNMTRTTAWCSVSGVVALIRMSAGTSLSKGTVQLTVKAAQRCVSICIILVFIEFV